MIPAFNDAGLLPPGIHRVTKAEFEQRFVRFDRSDRRVRIYEGLRQLLVEVKKMPYVKHVYLAGSYVTSKPEPNDFDCLLVIDPMQFPEEVRPFEYRVLSRRAAAKNFGGDVITVVEGATLHFRYLDFFQTTRDGAPVGIVELIQ